MYLEKTFEFTQDDTIPNKKATLFLSLNGFGDIVPFIFDGKELSSLKYIGHGDYVVPKHLQAIIQKCIWNNWI